MMMNYDDDTDASGEDQQLMSVLVLRLLSVRMRQHPFSRPRLTTIGWLQRAASSEPRRGDSNASKRISATLDMLLLSISFFHPRSWYTPTHTHTRARCSLQSMGYGAAIDKTRDGIDRRPFNLFEVRLNLDADRITGCRPASLTHQRSRVDVCSIQHQQHLRHHQ